jgi:NAD(P)H-hydrate epimerase
VRLGYSAEQVRVAEVPHLERGEPLMARAAAGLAAVIEETLPAAGAAVLVLAGPGNNGADALYAAATVARAGAHVVVVATGDRVHEEALAEAAGSGARIERDATVDEVVALARASAVVMDGILGTGTSADPALRGRARELVTAILPVLQGRGGPSVVAVDIPSGIDPTTGAVPDPAVLPADVTVTFGGLKAGLLQGPATGLVGDVRLIDIGLAAELAAVDAVVSLPD